MTKKPNNMGASVQARLLNLSRERNEDFQLVLTRYANERLLYRLSTSPHAKQFVLKGAALFTLWTGAPHRATRDIDFLGFGDATTEWLRAVLEDVIRQPAEDDGVLFGANSLQVAPIREDQEYGGIRAVLFASVVRAKVRLQWDVGFGDAITPAAEIATFPTLLDFEAPRLRAYPKETVVAEKVEAMVQLGIANSRMKDFYDVAALAQMYAFDGATLARACKATFERRKTPLPEATAVAFTEAFSADAVKNTQWTAFVRKAGLKDAAGLATAVANVRAFAEPALAAARNDAGWRAQWPVGGPWTH